MRRGGEVEARAVSSLCIWHRLTRLPLGPWTDASARPRFGLHTGDRSGIADRHHTPKTAHTPVPRCKCEDLVHALSAGHYSQQVIAAAHTLISKPPHDRLRLAGMCLAPPNSRPIAPAGFVGGNAHNIPCQMHDAVPASKLRLLATPSINTSDAALGICSAVQQATAGAAHASIMMMTSSVNVRRRHSCVGCHASQIVQSQAAVCIGRTCCAPTPALKLVRVRGNTMGHRCAAGAPRPA